ncbi:MAG: ABC transporter permease [Deltaproteobacteria bacterium]|nr:MAG: ABC transporter permease [Deltaproteobacteria bacterium]
MSLYRRRPQIFFLLPALFVLALVMFYPLIYVLWLSFHRRFLIFNVSEFIGFGNYVFLFLQDERFWNALYNTLYFTVTSVFLELVFGLAIAVLLSREFRGRGGVLSILLIPWVIPAVVSAKIWEWIYNPDFGILNFILKININWLGDPFWALNAAVLVDVWKATPFVVLLLIAGFQTIPNDLFKAAKVDGASSWHIFWCITLPLLKPTILVVLVFRTLDAFRVFDTIYVLTAGGPANTTETLSIYTYKLLFHILQFGYGSSVAVVIFVFTGIVTVFYMWLLSRG